MKYTFRLQRHKINVAVKKTIFSVEGHATMAVEKQRYGAKLYKRTVDKRSRTRGSKIKSTCTL